jgi:hypothetical protein
MGKIRYWLIITLIIMFWLLPARIAQADSSNQYYDYNYRVQLSKTKVQVNEPFLVQVQTQGTCKENLPATVNEGIIKAQIIARHRTSDETVILNPEFEIKFDGIPSQAGQSFKKDITVTLVFPSNSQPGMYDITAQTTSALFQVLFFWVDGLSYLSTDPMVVGSIECLGTGQTTGTPVISSTTQTTPATSPTTSSIATTETSHNTSSPVNSSPAGNSLSPKPTFTPPDNEPLEKHNPWPWVGYIGGGAMILGLISWQAHAYVRRRNGKRKKQEK